MPDPSLVYTTAHGNAWAGPGIQPTSSWILVRFVTSEPQWKPPFFFLKFYWSRVDLQYCDNFHCATKWFSYVYTHIHSFSDPFPTKIITEYWVEFSVIYTMSSLANHPIYHSVHKTGSSKQKYTSVTSCLVPTALREILLYRLEGPPSLSFLRLLGLEILLTP